VYGLFRCCKNDCTSTISNVGWLFFGSRNTPVPSRTKKRWIFCQCFQRSTRDGDIHAYELIHQISSSPSSSSECKFRLKNIPSPVMQHPLRQSRKKYASARRMFDISVSILSRRAWLARIGRAIPTSTQQRAVRMTHNITKADHHRMHKRKLFWIALGRLELTMVFKDSVDCQKWRCGANAAIEKGAS